MSLPNSAISLDEDGRLRINRAGAVIRHAQIDVGDTEVELTAGLTNRKTLIIKPVRVGGASVLFIRIGGIGFTTGEGTPVWEEYELVLSAGPDDRIFAKQGDEETDPVDVRVLEIGEE